MCGVHDDDCAAAAAAQNEYVENVVADEGDDGGACVRLFRELRTPPPFVAN